VVAVLVSPAPALSSFATSGLAAPQNAPGGTQSGPLAAAQWRAQLGDPQSVLTRWFTAEVAAVARADRRRAQLRTAADRATARRQLWEMLGLPAASVRPDLRVTVTATLRE
jgi:hypothetical protein